MRRKVVTDWDVTELAESLQPAPWMKDALCLEHREVEFFAERGEPTEPAKAICARCLVRNECRDYAIENEILDGVWGGTSKRDREVLIRRRPNRTRNTSVLPHAPRLSPESRAELRARESNETEQECIAANRLGTTRMEVQRRAQSLWGCSLVDERQRRERELWEESGDRSQWRQRSLQIREALIAELHAARRARTA